ncbi:MAG: A/G-specific adenine glycosylase [Phycisphaerae bacterium]|nr:A/G-specific adenine glycosylase [Phycisphaerae bacterium]
MKPRRVVARPDTNAVEHLSSAELTTLRRALLRWFRTVKRDLPWRRTRDPYQIWLSEIMLQQTRVEAVVPYFERFTREFPTLAALAAAPEQSVLKLWAGLGYYSRARNLHRAAREVVQRHNGEIPTSANELLKLPGVGRYTAAAIASIAFDEPAAVLDGNVKRVLARLFALDEPINDGAVVRRLWQLAESLLSRRSPGDFNQAMMELGATVCVPRGPRCMLCPIRKHCAAAQQGIAHKLPVLSAKRAPVVVTRACIALRNDQGEWLVAQRSGRGLLGGLWEFPTVEVPEAIDEVALEFAWHSEYGVRPQQLRDCGEVRHQFTHRDLTLRVLFGEVLGRPTPRLTSHAAFRWVSLEELESLPLAKLERKVLTLLAGFSNAAV